MQADFPVVLDACVLANNGVADLLLRLAEGPRLYLPLWTEEIIQETNRTLLNKLGWPPHLVASRESEMRKHFPEAWVTGHEPLVQCAMNEPKDRHVLAAAIRAKAEVIVTFNLKHFPESALTPWGIVAKHPGEFLTELHDLDGTAVLARLHEIARDRDKSVEECLCALARSVRPFALEMATELNLELDA